ncbi:MAG: glycerate kinase [Firmicutes bacterium]|nr:glycerate kinase [Bacillota bacterium]
MRLIIAPDSFKGTLTSRDVIEIIAEAANRHFPGAEIIKVPIADGGEGTVDSLLAATDGERRECRVLDPLGREITAKYGVIRGETAIFEMAQASGLPLLSPEEQNPLRTSTYGTGQMLKAAIDEGVRHLIIGIGGSATNDGGIGAARALGVKFYDANGNELGNGGQDLGRIAEIDMDNLDSRISQCKITVICDVNNPLTGPDGATRVYGPQKGASGQVLEQLEAGMENYRRLLLKQLGTDFNQQPGAGAAGGLGAALLGFLGATLRPGTETILDLVRFDELLNETDLVITGEGRIDRQTAFGKVPVGIARRCQKKNIPVIAIGGTISDDIDNIYDYGIDGVVTCINREMTLETAMADARKLLAAAADRMFRLIKVGANL